MIVLPPSVKWVAVSAHPAHAMRGFPQAMPHIREAIARGKRFARGIETRPEWEMLIRPSPEELRAYIASRAPGAPIFIDVETPRDNPERITIVGISVRRWSAAVVPWLPEYADIIAEVLADPSVVKGGHNFAYDTRAFRANGCIVEWPVVDTIQAEALLYPPFKEAKKRQWLSLVTCVLRRFPGPHWKNPADERSRLFFRLAFPKVPTCFWEYLYCGLDVGWNWMLWERQREELDHLGMLRLFQEIVAPAGYEAALMEDTGVPIDEERQQARKAACAARIAELEGQVLAFASERHAARVARLKEGTESVKAEVPVLIAETKPAPCTVHPEYTGLTNRSRSKCDGCRRVYEAGAALRVAVKETKARAAEGKKRLKTIGDTFEPTNDNHWRWLLFTPKPLGLGLTPTRMTGKSNLPGVGKDDIADLQAIYPDAEVLGWRREIQHRHHQMAFVYEIPVDRNGRAHATFPLHKTENGRFSSGTDEEEPEKVRESDAGNLQNITEVDRQIFCAPPGYKWVEIDGSQFELRAMAWEARALELLSELAAGVDVHSQNAAAIYGCKPEEARALMVFQEGMWQDARRAGKRPTHGWDYGLGDVKCGKMFKPMSQRTLEEVRVFLAEWAERTGGREGVTPASWDRRWRAAERAADPETEMRKFRMRRYEEANTLRAREWRLAYFKKRWELARFQKEVIERVTARGEHVLTNSFSRRLKFWGFRWNYQTSSYEFTEREEALAFIPASDVGDMAKWLMRPLGRCARKHGGFLVHMGHDSFSACVPDEQVPYYVRAARQVAEREWPEMGRIEDIDPMTGKPFGLFRCPFEAKVGQNWGPLHLHDEKCKPGCERFNPDGLSGYKEAA